MLAEGGVRVVDVMVDVMVDVAQAVQGGRFTVGIVVLAVRPAARSVPDTTYFLGERDAVNRTELIEALNKAGVAPSTYSLKGNLPSEKYCLEQRSDGWAVYYSERGQRTGEVVYGSEDEACDALYSKLVGDPTTRSDPSTIR
ncbi:MAG TPA: hypothetical protein VGM75_31480 [Pseudonocardiaceae bacterium]